MCFSNPEYARNTQKTWMVFKTWKRTAKLKVMENCKRSLKKSQKVMEFNKLKSVQTLFY